MSDSPPKAGLEGRGALGPEGTPPEEYWERRLTEDFSLQGVGYQALGRPFNEWAYRVRRSAVQRSLNYHGVHADQCDILEIGFGTGFFVEFWTALRARSVTGLDLTQRAVEEVSARFPQHRFLRQDISDPSCPVFGMFDIVTVFDVMFHLLDDPAFESAIANTCRQVRPGGLLLLTDILSATATIEGLTQRSRALPAYRRILEGCGMQIVGLHPVFFTMSRSPDASGPWTRRASSLYWRLICAMMDKTPSMGRLTSRGPSVKLMVARRDA